MARVKRGVVRRFDVTRRSSRKRRAISTPGAKYSVRPKQAVIKAGQYAYRGRSREKSVSSAPCGSLASTRRRRLWRMTYSTLIDGPEQGGIGNRS